MDRMSWDAMSITVTRVLSPSVGVGMKRRYAFAPWSTGAIAASHCKNHTVVRPEGPTGGDTG